MTFDELVAAVRAARRQRDLRLIDVRNAADNQATADAALHNAQSALETFVQEQLDQ
jgi:hypothetical protein